MQQIINWIYGPDKKYYLYLNRVLSSLMHLLRSHYVWVNYSWF